MRGTSFQGTLVHPSDRCSRQVLHWYVLLIAMPTIIYLRCLQLSSFLSVNSLLSTETNCLCGLFFRVVPLAG